MKVIILGAGITGLAAGYDKDWPIYEASSEIGGVCKTYKKEGFSFQNGGPHWLFENDKTQKPLEFVKSLVDLKSYDRRAGVYYNKIFPYPIQGYSQKPIISDSKYFKSWLVDKFGVGMCNMFFHPFNEKYTAGLMDEIIQFDSYKTPTSGNGWVSKFHDPVDGLDSLLNKMAKKCNIHYNKKAVIIDTHNKVVIFTGGEVVNYDRLISTVPLDQMLKMCGQYDYDLPYSSVFVLNIGADPGPNIPKEHWLYIPFCKCNFYRVGFYTNVDNTKAPPGKVGLSVEMAFRNVKYDDLDIDYITYHIVQELQSWGWIGKVDITEPTWIRHAYTWNKTLEEREKWIEWLRQKNIICVGRYSRWIFGGILESISQAMDIE